MIKAGDVLQGRYAIVRPLGSGGFGSVFLATDSRLGNRNVAIKYFATAHMRPDEAAASAQLFQAEAHTLANLSHPNLTAVLDYFEVEGGWVLVMGYVPGDSLAAVQQRLNGPFGEEQVIDWAIELCNVLDYLHRQKPPLVFRDLKPSNIMRTPEGKLMLIDFGIVRSFKEGQHQDTVQLGTPGYAPPEQYGGQTEPRSDLYSLGATLYVLLTGERVTGGFAVPSVRARSPWVSERLDQLIQRLTALRPQDRPASAAAVRAELENLKAAPPGRPAALPADPGYPPGGNDLTGQQPRIAGQQTGQQPAQRPHFGVGVGGVAAGPADATRAVPGAPRPQPLPVPAQPRQAYPQPQHAPPTGPARQTGPAPVSQPQLPSGHPPRPAAKRGFPWAALLLVVLLLGGAGAAYAFRDRLFGGGSGDGATAGPSGAPPSLLITVQDRSGRGPYDLLMLALDGSGAVQAVPAHNDNVLGDRAPDGRLAYVHTAQQDGLPVEQIFGADPDGGNERQLTFGPGLSRAPRWSPDGKQIIFESTRDSETPGERDIYVMNADGSEIRRITEAPGWQGGPAWSPDGKRIAYHSKANQSERFEIRVLDLASGEDRLLARLSDDAYWPDWSPDGVTIAFLTERQTTSEYVTGIWTVAAAGGESVELTNLGAGRNRWPRWSPDGDYLAFESQRDNLWQVYVLDIKREEVKKISDGTRNDRWPNW